MLPEKLQNRKYVEGRILFVVKHQTPIWCKGTKLQFYLIYFTSKSVFSIQV